jgi:hypothetical protein
MLLQLCCCAPLAHAERRAGVNAGAGAGRSGGKMESSPVDDMEHDLPFDSAPMSRLSAFARFPFRLFRGPGMRATCD